MITDAYVKRIVLATIGSLGDLHPCLALAVELAKRGYHPVVASTEYYRSRVADLGIEFRAIRPAWNPTDQALIGQCESLRDGLEILYRRMILPHLRQTYDDLLAATAGADLLIAGELVYAAPLVAEKRRLRWVSLMLSPLSFFSTHDPSVTPNMPDLIHLRRLGRYVYKSGLLLGRMATRHWSHPVRQLRRELRLRRDCDPVFRDKFAGELVLALFSPVLAAKQPDWPAHTLQPGFVWTAPETSESLFSPELAEFLGAEEPPLVFTQGSAAVHYAGAFYAVSAEAAQRLGRRALLLGAPAATAEAYSGDVLALPYAPYSRVFPRAAINVHQGGSGTSGAAMRSGRPMLVVPYGWDQPDNAARIARLGIGLHVPRKAYSVETACRALERLLTEVQFATRAGEVGEQLRREDGLATACDAIEAVLLPETASLPSSLQS